jgi:hypothetical protein
MRDMGVVGRKRAAGFSPLPALLLLLLLLLPIFFSPVVSGLNYTKYRPVSSLRLERIQRHLHNINKPAVLTIEVLLLPSYTHFNLFNFFAHHIYIHFMWVSFIYFPEPRWRHH